MGEREWGQVRIMRNAGETESDTGDELGFIGQGRRKMKRGWKDGPQPLHESLTDKRDEHKLKRAFHYHSNM